jgi:hypothetical protein
MITSLKLQLIASLAASALFAAALASPSLAQNNDWRHGHSGGHWHGAAGAGSAYGHARYHRWPYRPGRDRVDEGPGFYQGYGHNLNNSCYPGESMYDGC